MHTMICIGDSLTEGTDIPVGHTWPALVANALKLNVINHGIGGDTTQGMLSRFCPEVVAEKPAFVFIMGGTNDLWWGLAVNTILANIFSMVVQARHHGIAPILGLPMPVNVKAANRNAFSPPDGGYVRFQEKLAALVDALNQHAIESELAVVDLYRPFLKNERDVQGNLFLPDGLHLNKSGHVVAAKTIGSCMQNDFNFSTQ